MLKDIELIIIAMDEEMKFLLEYLKDKYTVIEDKNQIYYSFTLNNINYILVKGKIGKVATAFNIGKLSSIYNIKRIYNLGTSGAYNKTLNIGDVVVGSSVIYSDVDVTGFGYEYCQLPNCPKEFKCEEIKYSSEELSTSNYKVIKGIIASADSFITSKNINSFLINKINPLCVEMEGGAVGQCAYILNIPFITIRSISDKIYKDNNNEEFDNNLEIVSKNCVEVLIKLIS